MMVTLVQLIECTATRGTRHVKQKSTLVTSRAKRAGFPLEHPTITGRIVSRILLHVGQDMVGYMTSK
jgi:hypothetical protein